MAFVRLKRRGGRAYAYLVESVWEDGATQPKQRVVAYLGREEAIALDDVPPRYRAEESVLRWFAQRAARVDPSAEEATARARLTAALLRGDRAEADRLARLSIAAHGEGAFLDRILAPLLHEVGEAWHAGRLTVADEHIVTRGVSGIVRALVDERPHPRRGGARVMLLNPAGEQHALALELLECRLLLAGHKTILVHGGAPRRDLLRRARETAPDLVLVSVTLPSRRAEAMQLAHALSDELPRALIAVGGQGIGAPRAAQARVRVMRRVGSEAAEALADEAIARR